MSLTADQAKVIADYTLSDYEHERAPTKRVIGAVPAGQESYAPSAKCMTSLDLAWHVASSELFFLNGVCSGQFSAGESKRPDHIRNAVGFKGRQVYPIEKGDQFEIGGFGLFFINRTVLVGDAH